MRFMGADLSQKLGIYPIIFLEQAKELLLNGNYSTSVPAKMPGDEWIRRTELVYRHGSEEEIRMPYMEVPELKPIGENAGLNTFGIYYMPAVEEKYPENIPVWIAF